MTRSVKHSGLLLWAVLLGCIPAMGRTLTPEEALDRLDPQKHRKAAALAGSVRLIDTRAVSDGTPGVYTFASPGGGYIVVSADDLTVPLLAYSAQGRLEEGQALPPALEWWLGEYARQVEWNAAHQTRDDAISLQRPVKPRPAIDPMLTTSWDQGAPYNDLCPSYDGQKTWTGCVATSMAQVMNYWKYPEKGTGSISYNAESIQKRLSLNFELRKFDWDNMISTYLDGNYSEEESAAVAYLMKACGYAVKMDYGIDASGTMAMNIPRALKKYFGYDASLTHELRQLYTATEWEDIIHASLAEGCPVIYGGGSMIGGGHSFVCDGYDGEGYFHMNWGWTGMADGYFMLDGLNPYALGTGGGSGGGYNFTQDAVCGVRPATGTPAEEQPLTLVQTGSLAGVVSDGRLILDLFAEQEAMWVNYNSETMHVRLGVVVKKEGDDQWQPRFHDVFTKPFELAPGYGTGPSQFTPYVELSELDYLDEGCYRLEMACWSEGCDGWTPVKHNHGYSPYLHLTRQGTQWKLDLEDVWRLELTDAQIVSGGLYYGLAARFAIQVYNAADYEITRGFAPMIISDGQAVMLGESVCLTLGPGETAETQWTTPLYVLSQSFRVPEDMQVYLTFFDESTYNFWAEDCMKKITIHPNPGTPVVETIADPTVPGASTEFNKSLRASVYKVEDKHHIPVECTVRLREGMFGYEMLACIVNDDMSLESYVGDYVIMGTPGEEYTFSTVINCPTMVEDKTYRIMMGYAFGQYLQQIGPHHAYVAIGGSGVDEVSGDTTVLLRKGYCLEGAGTIELYDLSGRMVASAKDRLDLSGMPAGVYVARCGECVIKTAI